MRKKMIWGLGVLILIIGLVGVSVVLLMRNTDTEPPTVYRGDVEPSKEIMDSLRNQSLKNNPPPAEPGYKWVWHHNHWDKVPISAENTTPNANQRQIGNGVKEVPLPSTTEKLKRRKWLREGEVKEGHFYLVDEDGYLVCDEKGELIQTPYGDPAFRIFTVIGFRPTYEEYQEYKRIEERLWEVYRSETYRSGDKTEYKRINAELSRFRREHQGELPDLTATTVFPDDYLPRTPERSARLERLTSAKKDQLYREWGLGYLRGD